MPWGRTDPNKQSATDTKRPVRTARRRALRRHVGEGALRSSLSRRATSRAAPRAGPVGLPEPRAHAALVADARL
eukprot:7061505-Prymnesium_polylepis.1